MAGRTRLPAVPESEKVIGLKSDPDLWGSLVLLVGGPASRALTYLEHLEFLASVKEGGFKVIFDLWNGLGWWIVGGVGLAWLLNRFSKRNLPHEKKPTWSVVVACAFMAAVFGSIITVQSYGTLPNVILGTGYQSAVSGQNTTLFGYSALVNGNVLLSFKKDYKVAIAVATLDPQVDQLADKHILVSPLFEISAGPIPMAALASPNGDFNIRSNTVTVNYFTILVPRGVQREKITTLGDLLQLGGKILDPKYYK
jgi:hypothetical protein